MKRTKYLIAIAFIAVFVLSNSCKESFLEVTPNGSLGQSVLTTYDGVEKLLIGAYAMVDGVSSQFGWESTSSGWVFGSIRGMVANKGTDSGDQPDINPIQTYSETPTNPYLNIKWRANFEGVARCNGVISTVALALEAGNITDAEATSFINQARGLRGFYYLELWRLFVNPSTQIGIPYVDETTDPTAVTNTEDVRAQIIADLTAGTALPLDMGQVGRFNKSVCQVLLAKAQMNMYGDHATALPLLAEVEASGTNPVGQKAALEPLYGDIFNTVNRNSVESVYTVQYSVNDNSGGTNGGAGEVLNFPYKSGESPGGCCGFFSPTQDFVNSFRTDASGLPFLDTYNDVKVTNDQGLAPEDAFTEFAGQLDPRLDWAVGRRGIPYLDWGDHTGSDWIRDQTYAGPYNGKKQVYEKSQEGTITEVGGWTSGYTANGYRLIRFADVLLLKAECEAVLGVDDLGFGEVNAVRNRAANPAGFVYEDDLTTPAANYVVAPYASFPSQAFAIQAVKFERKLELGQEGHRYYDLQRWGDVVTELTKVMTYEKTMEWGANLYGNATIGPEDAFVPVPQRQVDLSNGNFVQNR